MATMPLMMNSPGSTGRLMMSAQMLDDDVGEIRIYGVLCYYSWDDRDTDSKAVRDALNAVKDAKKLVIHIHSPGGYLDEGMHMLHLIAQHGATEKHAIIEGECCSAATLPILACDHISVYEGSELMIHQPVGITRGAHEDVRRYADNLLKRTGEVAKLYAEKTGKPQDEIEAMMAEEFWMTAEEAVEYGFADEVLPAVAGAAMMGGLRMERGQMAMVAKVLGYRHVPEHLMNVQPDQAGDDQGSDAGDAMNDNQHEEREDRKMTREELQAQQPELMQMLLEEGRQTGYNEGVTAERQRMQQLDEIVMPGCEQMIQDAKYGDKPQTAEQVSVEMVRKMLADGKGQQTQGQDFMDKRKQETESMKKVRGQSAHDNDDDGKDEQDMAMFAAAAKTAQRRA